MHLCLYTTGIQAFGVADLYLNGWNLGRTDNLKVFGRAAADDLMRHLRLAYEEDVVFRADKQNHAVSRESLDYVMTTVEDGKRISIGNATVTAFAVDHHVIEPAFGYRVDVDDVSVVISGDTAYSENLIEMSAGADVVIHEVFSPAIVRFVQKTFAADVAADIIALHTLAPDVGRVFARTAPRLGVLTHLDNDPGQIPELREQVASTWDGEFVVAEDLMVIEIGDDVRVIRPTSGQ